MSGTQKKGNISSPRGYSPRVLKELGLDKVKLGSAKDLIKYLGGKGAAGFERLDEHGASSISEGGSILLRDAHWLKVGLTKAGRDAVRDPLTFDRGKVLLEAADALGGQIDQVAPDAYRALGKKWQFMREVEEYSDVALGKLAKVGEENFRKGLNARNFTDPSGKFNAEAAQKYFSTKGNQVFALRQQAKLLRQNGAEGLADQIDTSWGTH